MTALSFPDGARLRQVVAILFDLDGVLVDSRKPIVRSINFALESHGFGAEAEAALVPWIGDALYDIFLRLLRARGADSARLDACIASYREHYREESLTQTRVVPGASRAVRALARRYRLAVATSKPREFAGPILERLGLADAFHAIVGPPLHRTRGEGKTETVERTLASLGLGPILPGGSPAAAIVGDRHHDVVAGRTLGLVTLGATWGVGTVAELEGAGADLLVDSPGELTRLFAQAGRRKSACAQRGAAERSSAGKQADASRPARSEAQPSEVEARSRAAGGDGLRTP